MTKKKETLYKDLLNKVAEMRALQLAFRNYQITIEVLHPYEDAVDNLVRELEILEKGYTVLERRVYE